MEAKKREGGREMLKGFAVAGIVFLSILAIGQAVIIKNQVEKLRGAHESVILATDAAFDADERAAGYRARAMELLCD